MHNTHVYVLVYEYNKACYSSGCNIMQNSSSAWSDGKRVIRLLIMSAVGGLRCQGPCRGPVRGPVRHVPSFHKASGIQISITLIVCRAPPPPPLLTRNWHVVGDDDEHSAPRPACPLCALRPDKILMFTLGCRSGFGPSAAAARLQSAKSHQAISQTRIHTPSHRHCPHSSPPITTLLTLPRPNEYSDKVKMGLIELPLFVAKLQRVNVAEEWRRGHRLWACRLMECFNCNYRRTDVVLMWVG